MDGVCNRDLSAHAQVGAVADVAPARKSATSQDVVESAGLLCSWRQVAVRGLAAVVEGVRGGATRRSKREVWLARPRSPSPTLQPPHDAP
jgi:hypothetical protein